MIQRMDLVADTNTIKKNEDRRKKLMALLGGDNSTINPDLTQLAVGVPEKPEFDGAQAQQYKNMAKMAAIAQGIDAVVNAAGIARTEGKSNEWAPASSSVGDLGIASYNNLLGMDQAHRDQLNNWRDNVLDANKYNSDLAIRTAENQMDMSRSAIEQELKHITEMERQNRMSSREAALERGRLNRALVDQGLQLDSNNNIVPLEGAGGDEEEFKFTPAEKAMYESYKDFENSASPSDLGIDGKARRGTPTWHMENLIDKLGDKFYLFRQQDRQNQPQPSYDPNTDPTTQRNLRAANQTQQKMLMQNIVNAPDPQTRQRAAQSWYAMIVRELQQREDVNQEEIPQLAEQFFARQLAEQSGQSQSSQPPRPQMASPVAGQPSAQTQQPQNNTPQTPAQPQQQPGGESAPTDQAQQTEHAGRNVLPFSLHKAFNAGDKVLLVKNRVREAAQVNPNGFSTIQIRKELEKLMKEYKDQLNRLSDADRQKVIQAVGHNPFESQEEN